MPEVIQFSCLLNVRFKDNFPRKFARPQTSTTCYDAIVKPVRDTSDASSSFSPRVFSLFTPHFLLSWTQFHPWTVTMKMPGWNSSRFWISFRPVCSKKITKQRRKYWPNLFLWIISTMSTTIWWLIEPVFFTIFTCRPGMSMRPIPYWNHRSAVYKATWSTSFDRHKSFSRSSPWRYIVVVSIDWKITK